MMWDCEARRRAKVSRWTTWNRWFAWYPVRIIGRESMCVWWDWVEVKSIQIYGGMDDGWPWSTFYRRIGDKVDVALDPKSCFHHIIVEPEPSAKPQRRPKATHRGRRTT